MGTESNKDKIIIPDKHFPRPIPQTKIDAAWFPSFKHRFKYLWEEAKYKLLGIGLVTEEDEKEAKKYIFDKLGWEEHELMYPHGYNLVIKQFEQVENFVDGEGKALSIVMPENTIDNRAFMSFTGLVIDKAPDCYRGRRFSNSKQRVQCRIGDWVVFPRNEGIPMNYKGTWVYFMIDDRTLTKVQNPAIINRFKDF